MSIQRHVLLHESAICLQAVASLALKHGAPHVDLGHDNVVRSLSCVLPTFSLTGMEVPAEPAICFIVLLLGLIESMVMA